MTRQVLVLGILIWLAPMLVWAVEHCDAQHALAQVASIEGSVTLNELPATPNAWLCAGDVLRTAARSRAVVRLLNTESVTRLDQSSELRFLTPVPPEKNRSLLDLLKGAVYFFSREPRSLDVRTPFISAGVEGTEFLVRVESDRSLVSVFEGQVVAANDRGSLSVGGGQTVSATAGDKPRLVTVVRPRDAVQWALYYQPILAALVDASADGEMAGLPTAVRGAISRGEITEAFNALERVPTAQRDEDYHVVHAGLLLAVGRVEQARMAIERAFMINPASSRGRALQAIIAVTRNDKAGAFSLASEAVSLDARSVAARLALSYAQQAQFDLPAALESVQAAVAAHPQNALAWARLAELWLTQGELDQALQSAQQAVALSSELAHTQTVLGFAHLTQIKTAEAKQAFNRAIELDQAAPLPRLGLGLAKIREGELEAGREELEIAVSLDPDNSLYRSYMGKAYYEEKRNALATAQYGMAKDLDPLDPTPWLYDALLKQTENRPVEALSDLQTSIELNDNRAVYRSRLLLDEDEAARSAGLGRLFQDLGFQSLALEEGWRSVNIDPAEHSGHRLLADSYSALPRHQIARVSELLQSQLLQPINITPIQPQLAETDLFIIEGTGPSKPSITEFNPLFTRNRLALLANGVVAENNTVGDDFVIAGVYGKVSASLGQFHYETDGFRENNDLKQDIYNFFVQGALSPQTSIQAELRYSNSEKGDLLFRFDPTSFLPTLRQKEQTKSLRLGLRQSLSSNSDILASVIYQERNFNNTLIQNNGFEFDNDGYLAEIQHLFRSPLFNLTSGLGHLSVDEKIVSNIIPFLPPDVSEFDIRHTDLYGYAQLHYPKNMHWIFGLSADFFENQAGDGEQINPKLGLIWTPHPSTTIRAAAFRVFRRPLLTEQTIEPTQVAGFNQFFDDPEGTDAWRYGIGIEHKLVLEGAYAGLEFSRRDLDALLLELAPGSVGVRKDDRTEEQIRAYVHWTPHPWWTLSTGYRYELFKKEISVPEEIQTHRFPIETSFFHPGGLTANLKVSYIDQQVTSKNTADESETGSDRFWVMDTSIGYRLPKRWGFISIEGKNIFNQNIQFQETDPGNPTLSPERFISAKFTLAF